MKKEAEIPSCPYCHKPLKKFPSRRIKCPHCKEPEFVKSTPDDREKRIMTKEQADVAEALWEEYHDDKEAKRLCAQYKLDETMYGSADDVWRHLAAFGTTHDKIMANLSLGHSTRRRGENAQRFDENRAYYRLKYIEEEAKHLGANHVRISAKAMRWECCPECTAEHDKIYSLEEAFEKRPLPQTCCSNDFCKCDYEIVFDDEI